MALKVERLRAEKKLWRPDLHNRRKVPYQSGKPPPPVAQLLGVFCSASILSFTSTVKYITTKRHTASAFCLCQGRGHRY